MRVLKFSASWCNPCKMLDKQLDSLGYLVEQVDVETEEGKKLARDYGVRRIPTLIAVGNDGFMLDSISGSLTNNELHVFFNK